MRGNEDDDTFDAWDWVHLIVSLLAMVAFVYMVVLFVAVLSCSSS